MIKLENYEVIGWEHAIRGMRNPMNSWEKSDSCASTQAVEEGWFDIGPNDHKRMMSLRNLGTDHRKYMRMITVYVDITAPLYWWKEFDTYKVGTVANSCSTMHKLGEKEFTRDDFSFENVPDGYDWFLNEGDLIDDLITCLNDARQKHLEAKIKPMKDESKRKDSVKRYWWQMIQLLPSSYNQRRTIMLNYEVLANMYKSRKNHKLDEWVEFCKWVESLPYSEIITNNI